MTWIIIAVVVVLAIGPAMYLLPSAKDKRLIGLRAAARKHGLMVKITSVPKLDPSAQEQVTAGGRALQPRQACASYQLPINKRLHGVGEILLLRIPEQPTLPYTEVLPGWALDRQSDQPFWQRLLTLPDAAALLRGALAELPRGMYGCELTERYVACYWDEGFGTDADTVELIYDSLSRLKTFLSEHFAQNDAVDDNLKD